MKTEKIKNQSQKQTTSTKFLLSSIILTSFIGFSCSKKNTSQASLNSTLPSTFGTSTLAYCSTNSNTNTSVYLTPFVESSGQIRNDLTKLKFNSVSSTFYSEEKSAIQIFRWKADGTALPSVDQSALNITVFNARNGSEIQTGNNIRWSDIQTEENQTLSDFIFRVDLKDTMAEFDAVKIVLYSSDGQVYDVLDALIPVFEALPATYAKDPSGLDRSKWLTDIHPFKNNSTMTAQQLSVESKKYCF